MNADNQALQVDKRPEAGDPTEGNDDAVLLEAGKELSSSVYDTSKGAEFVTLQKDIVEEFFFPDTRRPAYRTVFTKGQIVPKALIDRYNADIAAAKERLKNGGIDPANPAGIDPNTIASGTRQGPAASTPEIAGETKGSGESKKAESKKD